MNKICTCYSTSFTFVIVNGKHYLKCNECGKLIEADKIARRSA